MPGARLKGKVERIERFGVFVFLAPGRTGLVHAAILEDFPDLSTYQVYACGAPVVIESAQAAYTAQGGLPAEEFFADSFTTEADKARA